MPGSCERFSSRNGTRTRSAAPSRSIVTICVCWYIGRRKSSAASTATPRFGHSRRLKRLAQTRHYGAESVMEHSEATETLASERYLLGEMSDEERNAFEEHFFGCGECARDVRDGTTMIDSVRAGKQKRGTSVAPWLVAAAAAVVVAF